MTSEDHRHVLQRFVAGLEVGPDELAAAIADEALDRTLIDQALLDGLHAEQATVRARAARRVMRMPVVAPGVVERLQAIAATDPDARVRASAEAAVRRHAQPAPPRPERPLRRRLLAALSLEVVWVRGSRGLLAFGPVIHGEAPDMGATLTIADGVPHLELTGLPSTFANRRPALLAPDDEELGRADAPVGDSGTATIALAGLASVSLEELEAAIVAARLVVYDD